MAKILVVDDTVEFLDVLCRLLGSNGYEVTAAPGGIEAIEKIKSENINLVITDVVMEVVNGMEVLTATREHLPQAGVILMTGHGTVETALESMKQGAFDYVTKPFALKDFLEAVQRALSCGESGETDVVDDAAIPCMMGDVVTASRPMRELCGVLSRVANTDVSVVLRGEAGVGKTHVLHAMHENSQRAGQPFIVVSYAEDGSMHVGTILAGGQGQEVEIGQIRDALALAHGGTAVFADIDRMSMQSQEDLLKALKWGAYRSEDDEDDLLLNVRLAATTSCELSEGVKAGTFREDLGTRIGLVSLEIKPLRERKDDILPLSHLFLSRAAGSSGKTCALSREVRAAFHHHRWSGNVDELQSVLNHAVGSLSGDLIALVDLPEDLRAACTGAIGVQDQQNPHQGRWLRAFLLSQREQLSKQLKSETGKRK